MPRRRTHTPLRVLINNRPVGLFSKQPGGAIEFQYDQTWLDWENAFPISLSLPLRSDAWRGAAVSAVFENLLPDSDRLRRLVAEKVGAAGVDAYSLLSAIGRDCVGAMQFIPENAELPTETSPIESTPIDDDQIERLLNNLASAPLGLNNEDDFRISIAGAQEKTALLFVDGQWHKPHGTTPTTHIFKKQIGQLPDGIDLSNSVENEFYCLKLAEAFGLPVNKAEIHTFGETKALVIERFDRRWAADGRLLRLPQEDMCQALSVPPTQKYQNEGGPGLVQILNFLKGSDTPAEDQKIILKAQMLFWLIGATDGHAKNFSIFVRPGGGYALTPLYDILTAQPSLDAYQINRNQMKLAMSVGRRNHYRIDKVHARHFLQTAERAEIPTVIVREAVEEMAAMVDTAITKVESNLQPDFPEEIHSSVKTAVETRARNLILPE